MSQALLLEREHGRTDSSGLALERVAVLAPHPDDEVLGAGGIIQEAIAAGGFVRVVFVTDGEANPWPLRVVLRRWRIDSEATRLWAGMRRAEALAALGKLGVAPRGARFLSLPDQHLLEVSRAVVRQQISDSLRDFRPTLIVAPSKTDLHADHRAVSYAVHDLVAGSELESTPQLVTYVIHGRVDRRRIAHVPMLNVEQIARKHDAISEHQTQLLLSRRRFLLQAGKPEILLRPEYDLDPDESRGSQARRATVRVARIFLPIHPHS